MESGGTDDGVNLLRRKLLHLVGRARPFKQATRRRQHDFIIGANRDDAGDELLKSRRESGFGKLEERGFRKGRDGFAKAFDSYIDVKRLFRHELSQSVDLLHK